MKKKVHNNNHMLFLIKNYDLENTDKPQRAKCKLYKYKTFNIIY